MGKLLKHTLYSIIITPILCQQRFDFFSKLRPKKVWGHAEDRGPNHDPQTEIDIGGEMRKTEEEIETGAERGRETEVEAETRRREEALERGMSLETRDLKVKSMV